MGKQTHGATLSKSLFLTGPLFCSQSFGIMDKLISEILVRSGRLTTLLTRATPPQPSTHLEGQEWKATKERKEKSERKNNLQKAFKVFSKIPPTGTEQKGLLFHLLLSWLYPKVMKWEVWEIKKAPGSIGRPSSEHWVKDFTQPCGCQVSVREGIRTSDMCARYLSSLNERFGENQFNFLCLSFSSSVSFSLNLCNELSASHILNQQSRAPK